MKPAFLMLSSCHVELWRQTRSTNDSETEISAAHLDKSCRWLQLVYGQGNPEVTSEERLEVFDTLSSVDTTSSQASIPFAGEPITSDKRRRTDLERDLQVLRGRQALQLQELVNTREAKRRLEDEATDERATRRRLERTLHDLETKLAKARRRVNDLQALVRMEANARRRSEQVVTEERARRKALEDHLKRQAQSARPLLEELAGLFQRAGPQVKFDAVVSPAPGGSMRQFNKASNREG
jgi:chromosome segregation ATPase